MSLRRHLLQSTIHLFLIGDGLGHLQIHYAVQLSPLLVQFEHRNVIDNDLPHRIRKFSSLYQMINNLTIGKGTFLSNSFFASVQLFTLSNVILHQGSTCTPVYDKNKPFACVLFLIQ